MRYGCVMGLLTLASTLPAAPVPRRREPLPAPAPIPTYYEWPPYDSPVEVLRTWPEPPDRPAESYQFPQWYQVREQFLRANRSWRAIDELVEKMQGWGFWQHGKGNALRARARYIHNCWWTLDDITYPYMSEETRQQGMKHLRDLLGEEDFRQGQMPTIIPWGE